MKEYELKATRQNGDATYNYDVIADYPIPFDEFWRNVLHNNDNFRVMFSSTNARYGGWLNSVEFVKHKGEYYFTDDDESKKDLWRMFKEEIVVACWANGGWGQMSYIVTFKED